MGRHEGRQRHALRPALALFLAYLTPAELVGTLLGFDEYVNMVLEDVVEYEVGADGVTQTRIEQILLNGNNVCLLIPGGEGPLAGRQ